MGVNQNIDCLQPSIFSYINFILERANRIARELDASAKRKTCLGRGWGPRKIARFTRKPGTADPACFTSLHFAQFFFRVRK